MRFTRMVLCVVLLCIVASLLQFKGSPVWRASAGSNGPLVCAQNGHSVSDGTITKGEYSDNHFDEKTKVMTYVSCDDSPEHFLHVGIISPWSGWVGFGLQSSDQWDEFMNEIRMSYSITSSELLVLDGYKAFSATNITPDQDVGGSVDVMNLTTGTSGSARVFEFSISLTSDDIYDNQLPSSGPYFFSSSFNSHSTDLGSRATSISDLKTIVVDNGASVREWTSAEFDISPSYRLEEVPSMLVSVRDSSEYPRPFTLLEVFVLTAFGFYDLGPYMTNEQGVAVASYVPRDTGEFLIGVAYPGDDDLLASVSWRTLVVTTLPPGSGENGGGPGGGDIEFRPVETIVVVTVLAVWATFGYALFITRQTLSLEKKRLKSESNKQKGRGFENENKKGWK